MNFYLLYQKKQADNFLKDLTAYKDKSFFYVAQKQEETIGILTLSQCRDNDKLDTGEIISIYVLPSYWRKGYGSKMMEFALDKLSFLGYKECCLWVLKDNIRARIFYEKLGFSLDGREKEIYIGKNLTKVRYIKKLYK